ncbi:MAG: adenylate/guanylate cyclase domain-containing protein [Pseudomonadota bacterium]
MKTGEDACFSCGELVPVGARFCPSCGARLEAPTVDARQAGEHRHLTVMFCDLVEWTRLSTEIESEDLQSLLREYHVVCAEEIERRGGMVASYLGDGVMAYFGYPYAQENDAVRVAEAALAITARVREMGVRLMAEPGIRFACRVALHTGRVLVSEMGAGETRNPHAVTGVVPNLASRLEQFAPINGVAVSAQTKALVEGLFRLESLGYRSMKGIAEPVEVFSLLGQAPRTAVLPGRAAPLVGREAELAALAAQWAATSPDSRARRVQIEAEPGLGKTALAAAFLSTNAIPRAQIIEIAGAIADRNTPFACLRSTLMRWLHSAAPDAPERVESRIAAWFGDGGAAHADALSGVLNRRRAAGREGRHAVFAACQALITRMPRPVAIIVEDAHWVDPSTLEMLDRLRQEASGVFLLALTRPVTTNAWSRQPDLGLTLQGLPRESANGVIERAAGGPVEPALAQRIADITGGLPLYLEELTKSLIDTGVVSLERGVFRLSDLAARMPTPDSLLDLITARLDRLGDAKIFAQISAVLGRQFSRPALISVSGAESAPTDAAITALSRAGIVTPGRQGRLSFRHALFQKAAYESLVRTARHRWHARYLDWLQSEPDRLAETRPETLAFHLEGCDRLHEAAEGYLDAGLSANRGSASLEAAAHFGKARDLIARIEPQNRGALSLLRAMVLQADALLSARGPGAPQTRSAYESAIAEADATPESEWHFPAYWGWWRVSDSFATMAKRAERLLETSDRMEGVAFKLQANHCVWANAFQMGDLAQSLESALEGLELYDNHWFDDQQIRYGGHDCKVCALGEIALVRWLQGHGDATAIDVDAAITHAEELGHLGSLLHALDIAVMLHHYRRDPASTQAIAHRLLELGRANDLEDYRAKGQIFLGCAALEEGDLEAGLKMVDAGFAVMREIGTPEDFPVYASVRAAGLRALGHPEASLTALDEGRAVIAQQGVSYWGAEIAREEALSLIAGTPSDHAAIAARLAEAIRVAENQKALALLLRARITALDWARDIDAGVPEAEAELAAVLARLPEDAMGKDVSAARARLSGQAADPHSDQPA